MKVLVSIGLVFFASIFFVSCGDLDVLPGEDRGPATEVTDDTSDESPTPSAAQEAPAQKPVKREIIDRVKQTVEGHPSYFDLVKDPGGLISLQERNFTRTGGEAKEVGTALNTTRNPGLFTGDATVNSLLYPGYMIVIKNNKITSITKSRNNSQGGKDLRDRDGGVRLESRYSKKPKD